MNKIEAEKRIKKIDKDLEVLKESYLKLLNSYFDEKITYEAVDKQGMAIIKTAELLVIERDKLYMQHVNPLR